MYPSAVVAGSFTQAAQDGDATRRGVCDALGSPVLSWSVSEVFCLGISHGDRLDVVRLGNEIICPSQPSAKAFNLNQILSKFNLILS